MKSKQPLFQITAAWLVFPFAQALADEPVTFTILADFDYPGDVGYNDTWSRGINDAGDVAGYTAGSSSFLVGFVRFGDGHFSGPITAPHQRSTWATGLNNLGALCGYYYGRPHSTWHGFLLSGTAFTEYDVPGSDRTYIFGMNDAGDFCGTFDIGGSETKAFISIGGARSTFSIAGATFTAANGINNLNQCVGTYSTPIAEIHSWLREADGTITFLRDPSFAVYTIVTGINDRGWMVGNYWPRLKAHRALFYHTPTKVVEFEYPDAESTEFTAINGHGVICGNYANDRGVHGFIARVNLVTQD